MLNVKKLQTIECSFPLKNFPMECASCNETFWRFDMKKHFTISHPEEVIPEMTVIPEEEQNLIKKKKSCRKNCLKKEDLERLVNKELALLPIGDFWDIKKKSGSRTFMAISGSRTAFA